MNKLVISLFFLGALIISSAIAADNIEAGDKFRGGVEARAGAGKMGGEEGAEVGVGGALGGVASGEGLQGFEGGHGNISKEEVNIKFKKGEVSINFHSKLTRKCGAGGKGIRGGEGFIGG